MVKKLLLVLVTLIAIPQAIAQTEWTFCVFENETCNRTDTKEYRYGEPFNDRWTAPRVLTGSVPATNAFWGDPSQGTGKQLRYRDVPVTTPTPTPTPTPATGNASITFDWSAPTRNTDGTTITLLPLSYRLTLSNGQVGTTSALTYTFNGLADGTYCGRVESRDSAGTYSSPSGEACAAITAPVPTCTTPQPAAETQTVQCPTGTTGSWTQTRTYTAAAYPTCWTAGNWTPTAAPAGACVTTPVVTYKPLALVGGSASTTRPVYAKTATGTRGAKIGDMYVGPTTQINPPVNRVKCSLADTVMYGSTRYSRVIDPRVPTQYQAGYVSGCVSYGDQ